MTLPKQSALISRRNTRLKNEAASAEAARLAADPRRVEIARLQKESAEGRAKYDKLYAETGNKRYAKKSDRIRRRSFDRIRTLQRALRKGISVNEQKKRESSKKSRRKKQFAAKNQDQAIKDSLAEKHGAANANKIFNAMSPEAKATAYEQATNKDFVATPNTARQKDIYNVRQEANTQARASIEASGATNAGEYFNSISPKSTGVISVTDSSSNPLRAAVTPRAPLETTSEPVEEQTFFSKVKEKAKRVGEGFLFTDGLNKDSYTSTRVSNGIVNFNLIKTDDPYYAAGSALNVIPVGVALKGVQAINYGYKAYKASNFYGKLNLAGRGVNTVGVFAASSTAVVQGGTGVAKFYETQQLNTNLKGYNISNEEFRGVVSTAISDSAAEGKFNALKFGVSTRFGDNPEVYKQSLTTQLSAKGFSETEITGLIKVADNTRGTREVIEAGTLVAGAATTEVFGRAAFSATNRYVNKVFTRRALREGTYDAGGKFTAVPLSSTPYAPPLSSSRSLGVTTTTKGGVLAIGGFGEAASQELLTQNVRQTGRDYLAIGKQGAVGAFVAPALGVPIARSFEVGAIGKGKGINTFANVVDVFEYAGDRLADGVTKASKLSYRVPTVTVGGSPSTPTYAYGSTNVQAYNANYFLTPNKGQDTPAARSETTFIIGGGANPVVEAPAVVKNKVLTPTPNFFPSQTKQTLGANTQNPVPLPIPNDNKVPSGSRNTVPNTVPASVPLPVPVSPVVPLPVPVSPVVPTIATVIPIPVVTATPEAGFLAVGGGLGFGKGIKGAKKKALRYNPSAFSLLTGFKGSRPSKSAVKTGFSIRPISPKFAQKKGKKKGKNAEEELLSLSLLGKNGRKRKYKRLASY